ncbi:MAG: alpha/beta hydrolase [Sulfolobaceae archaeon]|nr:alpha/beta hydrolase [Sulfolobaceae archaeon]
MPIEILSNGVRINYQTFKGGNKWIVFVHHLAGSIKSWKFVYPAFMNNYNILVYDLRGHGLSSVIPGEYLIEDHSQDLKSLLELNDIKDPILIGHSIGTLISIDYSISNSIDKLILIGALYKAPNPDPYRKYVEIALSLGMEALLNYRRAQNEFSATLTNNPTAWTSLLELYREMNPLGYKYTVDGMLKAKDYSKELHKIGVPTLIVYGSEDKLIINKDVFHDNIKNSRIEIMNGYGHYLNFETPEALASIIRDFISH